MIKTYLTGAVLGIAGTIAVLNYVPAVDLGREASIVTVTPNGGNSETFRISVPADRIMLGAVDRVSPLPPDMLWPDNEALSGTRSELFKIRNASDDVIGVASRLAVHNEILGDVIEWVLHMPARGTMYVSVQPGADNGVRNGTLRAGTHEFHGMSGSLSERWIAGGESDAAPGDGTIELIATYVANASGGPSEDRE